MRPSGPAAAANLFATTLATEEGRTSQVVANLRRPRTVLAVDSVPSGAALFVNEREVGQTPRTVSVSAFVRATVELRKAGHVAYHASVVPHTGTDNRIKVVLEPR